MLPPQNRLYAITDRNLAGLPNDQIVAQLLLGGAKLIQLRDKQASARELLESARACRKLTRAMGATLIINDRVDVALAAEADGVHLGQEDMTPDKAREVLGPAAIIGLSTHSLDQFREGMKTSANYLALGPIFATTTKAFGAGSATIGKRQMIGEPAFVPVKTRQELLQEMATETI